MNAPVTSAPGMNKQWVERRAKAVSRGIGMGAAVMAARAENSEIWDIEGNRYIDFGGGIAVVNTGHRHPLVMKRVYEQLEKFTHTCAMVMPYDAVHRTVRKAQRRCADVGREEIGACHHRRRSGRECHQVCALLHRALRCDRLPWRLSWPHRCWAWR